MAKSESVSTVDNIYNRGRRDYALGGGGFISLQNWK
jgi:hypothetical protein